MTKDMRRPTIDQLYSLKHFGRHRNRIVMKFCSEVGVPNVINQANFSDNRYRGFEDSGRSNFLLCIHWRYRASVYIDWYCTPHAHDGHTSNIPKHTTVRIVCWLLLLTCSLSQTRGYRHHLGSHYERSEPGAWWLGELEPHPRFCREAGRSVSHRSIDDACRYRRLQQQRVAWFRL